MKNKNYCKLYDKCKYELNFLKTFGSANLISVVEFHSKEIPK